jgi:hypothetical protein
MVRVATSAVLTPVKPDELGRTEEDHRWLRTSEIKIFELIGLVLRARKVGERVGCAAKAAGRGLAYPEFVSWGRD